MLSPLIGSPTPKWSRCAEYTTYSFFNFGSVPRYTPTRFGASTWLRSAETLASIEGGSVKRGSGLPASASASNSANVCPDPRKRNSARAGLKVTVSFGDFASSSDGSAIHMPGCEAASDIRDQGMSIDLGFGMLITRTAPDASTVF